MSSPILPKNFDVSNMKYTELKTMQSGSKSVYIHYGSSKLRIQTPVLSLPYGIGEGYDEKMAAKNGTPLNKPASEKKYDLTVSFKGMESNPKVSKFHDVLKEIEQAVINQVFDNRSEWLKDDYDGNKNFVAKLCNPIVKLDKDQKTGKIVGKYPPTLKVKLPYDGKNEKFTFDSYDMDNQEIEFESIIKNLKGAYTQLIIELTGIWIAGGKYGCSWKVISGKFQISQNTKVAFIEDSDTEKIENEENEEESDVEADIVAPSTTILPNSDEEEEEEKEEPVKQPVKKAGGRAKK
jgi:hypothetical protein